MKTGGQMRKSIYLTILTWFILKQKIALTVGGLLETVGMVLRSIKTKKFFTGRDKMCFEKIYHDRKPIEKRYETERYFSIEKPDFTHVKKMVFDEKLEINEDEKKYQAKKKIKGFDEKSKSEIAKGKLKKIHPKSFKKSMEKVQDKFS